MPLFAIMPKREKIFSLLNLTLITADPQFEMHVHARLNTIRSNLRAETLIQARILRAEPDRLFSRRA
jgi:hypothetical protein